MGNIRQMDKIIKLASLALLAVSLPVGAESCSASCLEKKALSGDATAARELAMRFIKIPKARYFWTVIAAENGDVMSQYNLAIELIEYPKNRFDIDRGLFWMCRSAKIYGKAEHYLRTKVDRLKMSGCKS